MKMFIKTKNNETEIKRSRQAESGNVLFLILIAVALFAALSYAVTSSSQSGGGDANDETNLISSSTVTQYPASVRTAIIRMQVSKGIGTTELEFNRPGNVAANDGDFEDCGTYGTVQGANCVFHPDGGQATYVLGSADVMVSGTPEAWIFSSMNEVSNIGRTAAAADTASATTAEVIAFLPAIREGVCRRINEQLGIAGVPTETGIDFTIAESMINIDGSTITTGNIGANGDDGTIDGVLAGQAFGCFQQPAGNFVYYHVLLEQ